MRAALDSHQQRLRLSDLGHFVGRRETFERGREDDLGVRWTRRRLVKLGERQCSLQAKATRALVLRDGNGGWMVAFGSSSRLQSD